ncbi:beta-propeller domain-containing protein [Bacillus timonensis]|nr:beta-propeller domain-containing protein [Bacillus timonensis]
MKKKILVITGGFLLFFAAISLYMMSKPKVVSVWTTYDESPVVLTDKVWEIIFSTEIDEKSMNQELIYVTNDAGEKQDITLQLSEDKTRIFVLPPKGGYDSGAIQYTLHVKRGIKSKHGTSLTSKEELTFVVLEDIPVVGTLENLNKHFTTAIKREKERQKEESRFFAVEESSGADMAKGESSAEGQGQDYSETNNQVQGVDEADLVKTDGSHIYQINEGRVIITKALPASQMKVEATLFYHHKFSPYKLFVHRDQLIVLGHEYRDYDHPKGKKLDSREGILPMPFYHSTKAIIYDISDRANPKQIREINVEGSLVTARKIDNIVYMISNHYPDYWILEQHDKADLRPRYTDSAVNDSVQPVDYDEIYYLPESVETNYTMIAAFNLDKPKEEATITTYLGSGHEIFMSTESIYLAVPTYKRLDKVATSRFPEYSADTNIYKFNVENERVDFQSTVEVQGTVLNQFSMDEHEGYFRIATTKGDTWNDERPSANNLYIFDKNLKQVGQLENLAKGERIYSARFMGDRIYIVTFKQVDPLFVIDASNPSNPTVLGELKIPGFSNYLHPYDENHLIGFGYDTKIMASKEPGAEPRVLTDGLKISLFDITDVHHPKEKFTEIIGGRGSYSPLNYDHKALLYNKNSGLFAFPLSVYQNVEGSEYEQRFEFQGAYIYNIHHEKGIQLQSKITHLSEIENRHYEEWESGITRLIYIGDYLYALSPKKITAHKIGSFEEVGSINTH